MSLKGAIQMFYGSISADKSHCEVVGGNIPTGQLIPIYTPEDAPDEFKAAIVEGARCMGRYNFDLGRYVIEFIEC
jgi:hypothetical protein